MLIRPFLLVLINTTLCDPFFQHRIYILWHASKNGKQGHQSKTKKGVEKKNYTKKQKCGICEKLKKGIRFHPEAACWFRTKQNENEEKNRIKVINNSELECELETEDQKN